MRAAVPLVVLALALAVDATAAGPGAPHGGVADGRDDIVLVPGTFGHVLLVAHPAIDLLDVTWAPSNATHAKVEWRVQDLGAHDPRDSLTYYLGAPGGPACPIASVEVLVSRFYPITYLSSCMWPGEPARGVSDVVEGRFDVAHDTVTLYMPLDRMPRGVWGGSAGAVVSAESGALVGVETGRDVAPEWSGATRIR